MAQAQITTVDLDEANARLFEVISEMQGTSDVAELQAIGAALVRPGRPPPRACECALR